MKQPKSLLADMSRYKRHGSYWYMLNFEHMRGVQSEDVEAVCNHLNKNGTKFVHDQVWYVIKGGVRPRIYTLDMNDMTMAIEILKRDYRLTLTYRGKLVK